MSILFGQVKFSHATLRDFKVFPFYLIQLHVRKWIVSTSMVLYYINCLFYNYRFCLSLTMRIPENSIISYEQYIWKLSTAKQQPVNCYATISANKKRVWGHHSSALKTPCLISPFTPVPFVELGESCTSWRDFLFFGHHTFKNKLSKLPIILKERGENELYASNF